MADVGKADNASSALVLNWESRPDPKKFEFGDGAELTGVLLDVERRQIRDQKTGVAKAAVRYTVREMATLEPLVFNPDPVFFYGTYQIDSKLRPSDVGHFVSILCKGEDKSVGRNGNAMKVFEVLVSKETGPGFAHDGTAITDDDLPPASSYN
jgi:hypothetical protein